MSDKFQYRVKGFDIRVKPPKSGAAEKDERVCEWDGCVGKGDCRAPQGPDALNEFFWFCQKHAAEYNKAWNFFHGMSEASAQAYRDRLVYGGRPTWDMREARPGQTAGTKSWDARMGDPFNMRQDRDFVQKDNRGHRLGRLQAIAMDDLGLPHDSEPKLIRARYLKLVKQFHPDTNKGDRSTEERLQQVIRAYQILKSAKLA